MAAAERAPAVDVGFLRGCGQTAQAIAVFDWSATPVGPMALWPAALRTSVATMVRSPVAMALLWGPEGTLLYNDAYAQIAGDRHPAALGAGVRDVYPEAAEFNDMVVRSGMAGRSLSFRDQPFRLERQGRMQDCWFTLDYSPVLDAHDQPAGVLAIVVETTETVRADTWRRGEQERLRRMFEHSPGFMQMLRGPTHVIDLVNPAYLQLIGHRSVLGMTVRDALPDLAGQGFFEQLDEVYRSGTPQTGHAVPVTFQPMAEAVAQQRFVDFVMQPVNDVSGARLGIMVQGIDVTDRVLAETMLRLREAQKRQILDSAVHDAIIAFSLDGRITRWNEGARRIFGWTERQMLGQDAGRLFTAEDRDGDRAGADLREAATAGVSHHARWHVRQSGERFWASGDTNPLHDDMGRPSGFVTVLRDRTEAHRTAERLRQSEERLRRAQEAGGVGTFTVDLATDHVAGTAEFFRLFGLDDFGSVPAKTVEDLVLPEDAHRRSGTATRGAQDAPLDVEYRIRRANDGALRWIARRAEFERDADGNAVAMVGVVLDMTERKAAEAAVHESAAQFQTLSQALPNHVWTADAAGCLDWFNDRTYVDTGVAHGALDGHRWVDVVHPDDRAAATVQWQAAVASGEPYETEFRIRMADGEHRWYLVRALPLRGLDGAVTRWIGTDTDIHARKLIETRSTQDRDRIWALSQELMLVCDFEGVILSVNPAATRLLGWRSDEMVGSALADFLHPDDLEVTAAEVQRLVGGATTLSFENRYRSKDGSYRRLDWAAVPDGGKIHAVARDVTRERQAEEALRQSQKLEAIGQLTGGVAHDFNNLLTVIRTSIELLRRPNLPDDRRQRFMESIASAVNRGAKLTGQLLAFARRQALQPVVFDAAQNVRAVGEMIATLVGSRIVVDVSAVAQRCNVNADPGQFDTAIINMAVNARDAMQGEGRLTIAVRSASAIPAMRAHPAVPGRFVAVSLTDTGSGIAPEQIERIFEPFFTTKDVGLGTGLGLSQVFGFAKQSGGDIQVDSAIRRGSVFTLYLPQVLQPNSHAAAPLEAPLPIDGEGALVLIVEDNHDVAHSVEATLREIGYQTVWAPTAQQALNELEADSTRFAAVFSDVVMAGMDGIQLAQEVRRRWPALPVLLSSGYSDVLAKDHAHGFDLLPKPYSLDALSQSLRAAIARRPLASRPVPTVSRGKAEATFTAQADGLETLRLNELDALMVLDTEDEAVYDEIARMAAALCETPIALVSLIDRDRQWFKSRVGLAARQTPRAEAFCAHAIEQPGQLMVVTDATQDARFATNPLVTGDPNIRFYAGAPLVTSTGHALGTLCVIDQRPRDLDVDQKEMLKMLAEQVVKRLEARRQRQPGVDEI